MVGNGLKWDLAVSWLEPICLRISFVCLSKYFMEDFIKRSWKVNLPLPFELNFLKTLAKGYNFCLHSSASSKLPILTDSSSVLCGFGGFLRLFCFVFFF